MGFWESLSQIFGSLASLARVVFNGIIWAAAGNFMPATCGWCRIAWMVGLLMGVILIFVYWKGPKTN